jgi:hypothetical protein
MYETAWALYARITKAEKVAANRFWPDRPQNLDKPKPKRVLSDDEKRFRRWVRRNEMQDNFDFEFKIADFLADRDAQHGGMEPAAKEGR